MANCKHVCCGAAEKVWLPYEFEGRSRGLKAHLYCIHCGVVKNERLDFDDIYFMTGSEQEEVFINVVQKYSKVREDRIRAFFSLRIG